MNNHDGYAAESAKFDELIDFQAIQQLMNTFHSLTQSANSILDLEGNVLVTTGWQDICLAVP